MIRLRATAFLLLVTVAGGALAQNSVTPGTAAERAAAPRAASEPARNAAAPARDAAPAPKVATPMAERVATIAILNKQNGLTRDVRMKPGQAVRWSGVTVRLAACEATPDWQTPMTGAFVQVDVAEPRGQRRRVFSGWTYKESPSLNAVQHPIYDVWVKDCAMSFPETGPDTVVVRSVPSRPASPDAAAAPAASNAAQSPTPRTEADSSNR